MENQFAEWKKKKNQKEIKKKNYSQDSYRNVEDEYISINAGILNED